MQPPTDALGWPNLACSTPAPPDHTTAGLGGAPSIGACCPDPGPSQLQAPVVHSPISTHHICMSTNTLHHQHTRSRSLKRLRAATSTERAPGRWRHHTTQGLAMQHVGLAAPPDAQIPVPAHAARASPSAAQIPVPGWGARVPTAMLYPAPPQLDVGAVHGSTPCLCPPMGSQSPPLPYIPLPVLNATCDCQPHQRLLTVLPLRVCH